MEVLENFINVQNFIEKSIQKSRFGVGQQGNVGRKDNKIDLNEYLIRDKNATFFFKLATSVYEDKGIHNGSILVIDRSLFPNKDDYVLCFVDGNFVLKEFITICDAHDFEIWGVLSGVVNRYH